MGTEAIVIYVCLIILQIEILAVIGLYGGK